MYGPATNPTVEDAAVGAPSVDADLPSSRPFLREMPKLGGRRLLHLLPPEKMVSGSAVGAAAVDAAPTPCPSQMTIARWLLLPLRLAVGHHAPGICVFASARRFFVFPFGLYPKWVMRLSLPLEADFGMQSTLQDLFLHLGLFDQPKRTATNAYQWPNAILLHPHHTF